MMMQCNGSLNQTLQKLLFRTVSFPPHIFPNFVRVEEVALIEELNPALISVHVQTQILTGQMIEEC